MFGQRLLLARKASGLSRKKLASVIKPEMTEHTIRNFETGKKMPNGAELIGLSNALKVSVDYLFTGNVDIIDEIEFRKKAKASVQDRAKAEVILIESLENYLAIEYILGIETSLDWLRRRSIDLTESKIDELAQQLRSDWELDTSPIPNLCDLLEGKGLKVVEADLPERVNGLSCHAIYEDEIVGEAVMVSSQINIEFKRFTLAHELAHRLIGSTNNPQSMLERAMNRFAGAFLVPESDLVREWEKGRERNCHSKIIRLKHFYGVSAAALLMRLEQVGKLTNQQKVSVLKTYGETWRTQEPEPISSRPGLKFFEKPRRFEQLVFRAVRRRLISPVRASAMLKQPYKKVMKQVNCQVDR